MVTFSDSGRPKSGMSGDPASVAHCGLLAMSLTMWSRSSVAT